MYKAHTYSTEIRTAATNKLVKGLPGDHLKKKPVKNLFYYYSPEYVYFDTLLDDIFFEQKIII